MQWATLVPLELPVLLDNLDVLQKLHRIRIRLIHASEIVAKIVPQSETALSRLWMRELLRFHFAPSLTPNRNQTMQLMWVSFFGSRRFCANCPDSNFARSDKYEIFLEAHRAILTGEIIGE